MNDKIYEQAIKRKDLEIKDLKYKNTTLLTTIMDQQRKISELNSILRKLNK